jgi:alpha-tubulin suppressor-like RCC1 family protein
MISPRGQSCGITLADEPYCWGYNAFATLGRTTSGTDRTIAPVGGDVRLTMVDGDGYSACGLDRGGRVWCWGSRAREFAGSPELSQFVPRRLETPIQFSSIMLGYYRVCGIAVSRDAYCWGSNSPLPFRLGVGSTEEWVYSPSLVVGGHKWKQLAGSFFTCGITEADKLFCWGSQAGFRERDETRPQPVAPALSFRHVSVSYWGSHNSWVCAVTLGGETYCFGAKS